MRRPQFSLRTLLIVVTAICLCFGGFIGWQRHQVERRAEVLAWLAQDFAAIYQRDPDSPGGSSGAARWWVYLEDFRVPWYRKLLGDHFVAEIRYAAERTPAEDEDMERLKTTFPEADIHED